MKFKRRFNDSSIDFKGFSKRRLIIGIVLGFLVSFVIYVFQYVFRETFRLLSSGFSYFPNILTEDERFVFGWFMASLSLVFGNSIAVSFIFSGRKRGYNGGSFNKRRVVNDQTFLNSVFIFWFAKISFMIGIFSMAFADFNFMPEFKIPLVLLILVLYFETWKTLIRVLGRHKYKYLALHFLAFCLLSFGMSKIEFVDYKKIDSNQLEYRPILNLPESSFTNLTYRDSYFSLVTYLNNENYNELSFGHYKNDLNNSYTDFLDFKLSLREEQQFYASGTIFADRNTKMEIIKLVKNQMTKAGVDYVIYGTKNDVYAKRFFINGLKSKIINKDYNDFIKINDTLKIKISGSNVIIDGLKVLDELLVHEFEKSINKNTLFEYEYSLNTEYQDYLKVISAYFEAISNIRKREEEVILISEFRNGLFFSNEKEYRKDQSRLRKEYPVLFIEKFIKNLSST